jgi:hypothetical protein
MMLPLLEYINTPKAKWFTCFGVPYVMHIWQVNEASSLNGAFKIALTKAKRNYIKHHDTPKFKPADIVPLTYVAFSNSFATAVGAKSAIQARGWNPLNYYLFTVLPGMKQDVVDLTDDNQESKKNLVPMPSLSSVNVSQGFGTYCVDLLIQEELKNEVRKKRNEEIKSKQKKKQQKVEHIKRLPRFL